MSEGLVIDASAMVDLLIGSPCSEAVSARLRDSDLHAPAHFDAEVLSALGRLCRAEHLSERQVTDRVERLTGAPVERHGLTLLLSGAWHRRHNLRLVDALYVELAEQLGLKLLTTDAGLAAVVQIAELVEVQRPT